MSLREWCLQYQEWKDICTSVKLGSWIGGVGIDPEWKDHTPDSVHIWQEARECIELIEDCCIRAGGVRANDILLVVTEDIPPEMLGVSEELYGRFFDTLSQKLQRL